METRATEKNAPKACKPEKRRFSLLDFEAKNA